MAARVISAYAKSAGLKTTHWSLNTDHWPLETGPESEWGSEPGLAEALEAFCKNEGFRFVPHPPATPERFLANWPFRQPNACSKRKTVRPPGSAVECFSQFDATATLQSGLLPLWLIFNTHDSARYLKEMSVQFPKDRPRFLLAAGYVFDDPRHGRLDDWRAALGRDFINIGARRKPLSRRCPRAGQMDGAAAGVGRKKPSAGKSAADGGRTGGDCKIVLEWSGSPIRAQAPLHFFSSASKKYFQLEIFSLKL